MRILSQERTRGSNRSLIYTIFTACLWGDNCIIVSFSYSTFFFSLVSELQVPIQWSVRVAGTWDPMLGTTLYKYLKNMCILYFAGQSLNGTFLSPYLDSLGGFKFTNGANFAVVGSSTLPKYVPFSLTIQVMQFLHFKARTLELVTAAGII